MLFRIKEMLDACAYPAYVVTGRKPWRPGYYTAKRHQIEKAIDNNMFERGEVLPHAYGFRLDERVIEYPWVFSRLSKTPGTMLDAGSALNHKFLVRRSPVCEANLTICTLEPEKRCYYRRGISYIYDDLRASMFRSGMFDTIVSISTIEHIGLDNTFLYTDDKTKCETDSTGFRAAVREFRRVIKTGGECFITVPYGKANVHGWYQVFDSSMVQTVVDEFRPSQCEIDYFGYWPDGWRSANSDELVDATSYDVHQTKGFDMDYAAGARGLACMYFIA